MNRKELLEVALTENKNVTTVVVSMTKKDLKALEKAKRDITDEIDKLEEDLEERLSANTPLDKSVVEVTYRNLKSKKETENLYDEFIKKYLTESK